ncbi:MAG: SprT family zinc-dependent metalloprotease [Bacteroidales bacterium]
MKNEKRINYKGIGEVMYRKNRRARNVSIRINAEGVIRVTVPGWCSFHRAEIFVLEKSNWINGKILKIKRNKQENLVWGAGDVVEIRNGKITIEPGGLRDFKIIRSGSLYTIQLPVDFDPAKKEFEEALREAISVIGLREAKAQLPEIIFLLAEKFQLPFGKLSVKRMRTRWGSCSSKNNISLNSGLIFLPNELIEYVCLHELVHTVHKNHSRVFWEALDDIMPGALMHRKALHKRTIIA